jgi:hypothetical protein
LSFFGFAGLAHAIEVKISVWSLVSTDIQRING